MDSNYSLVNDHLNTAEKLLLARKKTLTIREEGGGETGMELKRVGSLMRSINRARRDLAYWFDSSLEIKQNVLPRLEKDYYDGADVPESSRFRGSHK